MKVTTQDGVDLNVRDWGTGRPILFVHSWSMTADLWRYQMVPFSKEGYRTISYDLRGHGQSDHPGVGYDLETMTDDLAAVIQQLDLRDVVLVGHSLGCSQILRYLSKYGDGRISKIALIGTITPYLPLAQDNPGGVDPAFVEANLKRWETDSFGWIEENTDSFLVPTTPDTVKHWVWTMACQASPQAQIEANRSCFFADLRPDARAVKIPTLIVHGTADVSAPLDLTARATASLIPGSMLKVYDDAPHGLLITEPGRLNADLAQFIAR